MIRKFFERRRARWAFEKLLDKRKVEAALQSVSKNDDLRQLKPAASIELLIAAVRGGTLEIVSHRMGLVTDAALKHGATVCDMVSSIVIVAYGISPWPQDSSGNRFTLTQQLTEELREDVKIIHCRRHGVYGTLGSSTRMSYSFIIPDFVELLGQLATMEFGQTKEIPPSGALGKVDE